MPIASRVVRFACSYLLLGCAACSSTQPAPAVAPTPEPATKPTSAQSAEPLTLPTLPSPTLAAPAGAQLAFSLDAKGAQIYACQAEASGFVWALKAPDAALSDRQGQVVVKHYAGPTWEWLADGSKVEASKLQAFSDDPAAIPELLLKVNKHEGQGRMSDVTYIQRLSTARGLAPASGCDAAHVDAVERVDYTATYYFYRGAAQGG